MSFPTLICLLSIYIIWGSTFAAIKLGLEGFDPIFMAALRFTFAGVLYLLLARFKNWQPVTRHQVLHLAPIGFGICLSNALVCWSELGISTGVAALVVCLVPIFMVLLNWGFFEKKRPTRLSLSALVVSLLGLSFIVNSSLRSFQLNKEFGYLLGLVASALLWALASLAQRKNSLPAQLSFFQSLGLQTLFGGLSLFVVSYFVGETFTQPQAWGFSPTLALIYLVTIGTVLAFSCYIYVLKRTTPQVAGTYALVNPLVAVIIGILWFDEKLTVSLLAGAALILMGVATLLFEKSLLKIVGKS